MGARTSRGDDIECTIKASDQGIALYVNCDDKTTKQYKIISGIGFGLAVGELQGPAQLILS